jgi:hypothetical protein
LKRIELINPSLHAFCYELQEAIQNGYEIDPDLTPVTWGIVYQTGMVKKNDVGAELFVTKPSQIEELVIFKEAAQQLKKPAGRPKKPTI